MGESAARPPVGRTLASQVVAAQVQFGAVLILLFPLWEQVSITDPQGALGQDHLGALREPENLILQDLLNLLRWKIQEFSQLIPLQPTTM